MKSWFAIICLMLNATSMMAEDAALSPTVTEPSPEVQEILAVWNRQAQSIEQSVREWKLIRQYLSEDFGFSDGQQASSPTIRVQRWQNRWRLDGESVPPASLTKFAIGLTRKESTTAGNFQAALADRFQRPVPSPLRRFYQFLSDPAEERHVWLDLTDKRAAAVAICPPGESAACFERPLFSYLLEAEVCLVGLGIPTAGSALLEYELLPDMKPFADHSCRALQVWRQGDGNRQLLREFWMEQEAGNRLRRCILPIPDSVVIQFDDFPDEESRFPQRVTLLRLANSGDVADQLTAVLRTVSPDVVETQSLVFQLPSGSLVADFIQQKRLMTTQEGGFREITLTDLPATRLELLDRGLQRLNTQGELMANVLHWLTWPWILLPMGIFCVVWVLISRMRGVGRSIEVVSVIPSDPPVSISQPKLPSEHN